MKFFSYESRFTQILLKLCYSCYLNLFWIICSLPIVTIGASTTALYYSCLKVIRDQEGNVAKHFFTSFRDNFKQSTIIWLIMLGVGLFMGFDFYILYNLRLNSPPSLAVLWTILLAILIALIVLYTIVLLMIFPLEASDINTTAAMFKNAFLIGTHYLFAPILVFAIHFAMFFAVVSVFTPLIVLGEGFCAMLSSWVLNSLLIAVTTPAEVEEEEEQ